MNNTEFNALVAGDLVRVIKSGKVYRTRTVVTLAQKQEQNERFAAGTSTCRWDRMERNSTDFLMQRDGKDFGPIRDLKPENIERVDGGAK